MAKVKKMAFGGMGSRPSMGASRPGMGTVGRQIQDNSRPPGSIVPQQNVRAPQNAPETQSRLQQMPSRGLFGGNQAPAGANLLKAYNNQGQGSGLQSLDPNKDKAMQSYQAQAGQPTSPPPFKSIAGIMKKGGKVKGYAKGGSVKSSASSRGDGIAMRGKTKGRMV